MSGHKALIYGYRYAWLKRNCRHSWVSLIPTVIAVNSLAKNQVAQYMLIYSLGSHALYSPCLMMQEAQLRNSKTSEIASEKMPAPVAKDSKAVGGTAVRWPTVLPSSHFCLNDNVPRWCQNTQLLREYMFQSNTLKTSKAMWALCFHFFSNLRLEGTWWFIDTSLPWAHKPMQ